MPLQNRVTPFSEIVRSPARGTLTGNRGILHGTARNLLTQGWRTKAWISCALVCKDFHRVPMTPGTWTELFFLDEPSALAAGHRPCGYCRRSDFRSFLAAAGFNRAPALDEQLHRERVAILRRKERSIVRPAELPDYAFVRLDATAWLKSGDRLFEWNDFRYRAAVPVTDIREAEVLTAPTIVKALRNGYTPITVSLPVQFEGYA